MNEEQQQVQSILQLTIKIDFYFSVIVIPIGILFNLFTILIFSTHKHKPNTTYLNILYIGLCIYDSLALINSILFAQLLPSILINIVDYSYASCLILSWWRKIAIQAPSWVQVIITIERFISIRFVNRFPVFKSKQKTIVILVSVFFVLALINIGQIWFYLDNSDNSTSNSNVVNLTSASNHLIVNLTLVSDLCTASNVVITATDAINVLSRFLLPFIIMLVMNILLSKSLYEMKKRTSAQNHSLRRERNYTITVIGFNCLFCVLNLPWAVWYILSDLQNIGLVFQSPADAAILELLNSIAFSIFYLNDLSTFFLNFFFNHRFRRRALFLFYSGKLRIQSSSQISHNHNNHK